MKNHKNNIKKFGQFINENVDNELNISTIFRKYEESFEEEFNSDDWFDRKQELLDGLRQSLEMIGDGEITEKSEYDYNGDRLMYKELFKDDKLILVVHAAFEKHPIGGHSEGKYYRYEISVYRNDLSTRQIGGGYGTSGMVNTTHTMLLGSIDNYCKNKNIVSLTCKEVKKYSEDTF